MRLRWLILITLVLMIWTTGTLAQPQTLTYGQPVAMTLDGSVTRFRYTFEGTADDVIYATAFIPNGQPELQVEIFGINGTSLGSALGNAMGTLVGPITLTSTGRYTLEVSQPEYNVGNTGDFTVLIDRAVLTSVKPDGRYSGTLPQAGSAVFFSYTGPANELFGYAATGQAMGLFIRQPNGEGFLQDFDYGSGEFGNPLNVLPMEGEYSAFLQTANPAGTDYTFRLTPVRVVELESGNSANGTLTSEDVQVFRFASNIDELWRIDVTGDNMQSNVRLEIRNADQLDSFVAADQSSGVNGAPRLEPFISGADGTYYIILMTGDETRTYDFTLNLAPSAAGRLDSGVAQPGTASLDTGALIYIYFGVADEVIRVTLDTTSGQPNMLIYTPVDELASFMARSTGKSTFEVTLPQTGLYTFRLVENSYTPGITLDFTLMVESIR
ncbi:MAG: hypothetical protein H7X77_03430 [Anaerolineae bacterium]|nr:hypothetical protein [Anaerolineae bacterium]